MITLAEKSRLVGELQKHYSALEKIRNGLMTHHAGESLSLLKMTLSYLDDVIESVIEESNRGDS